VEPWAQRPAFLEVIAMPLGAKQRLPHRVLDVQQRAEHAVTVGPQLAAMTLDRASKLVHYMPPFERRRWISMDS